jgi:hypothetical protein
MVRFDKESRMMGNSRGLTGVLVLALLGLLFQSCSCPPGPATPTSPATKTTTRSFSGNKITLTGDANQINNIADVELVSEGDSRYPKPQDVAGDVTKIISVFEIKPKTGIKSVAPPPITIDNIFVGQKGKDLEAQGLAHLPLPIHRFDSSTNTWPKTGEATLKSNREWARGTIEKASLLAIVSTAPVAAPTQPPVGLEARIYESTKRIIANENPGTVSIIWGSEAAPYGEVAELTRVSFEEQGVEAAQEFIPDVSIVQERLVVAGDAGELQDCIVLIGVSGDVDSLRDIIVEFELSLYVYNEDSGYFERRVP